MSTNERQDKILLIALLEIVFLTFIAIFSIGFISVPSLFVQSAIERANLTSYENYTSYLAKGHVDEDGKFEDDVELFESIEDAVQRLLIFVDFTLIFHLIVHTLIVIGFNKASKKREWKAFRPWFIFNCIIIPLVLAGTIYGFVRFCCVAIAAFNHILNIIYLAYKGWAMFTVFMHMKELKNSIFLNDEHGRKQRGGGHADDDDDG